MEGQKKGGRRAIKREGRARPSFFPSVDGWPVQCFGPATPVAMLLVSFVGAGPNLTLARSRDPPF